VTRVVWQFQISSISVMIRALNEKVEFLHPSAIKTMMAMITMISLWSVSIVTLLSLSLWRYLPLTRSLARTDEDLGALAIDRVVAVGAVLEEERGTRHDIGRCDRGSLTLPVDLRSLTHTHTRGALVAININEVEVEVPRARDRRTMNLPSCFLPPTLAICAWIRRASSAGRPRPSRPATEPASGASDSAGADCATLWLPDVLLLELLLGAVASAVVVVGVVEVVEVEEVVVVVVESVGWEELEVDMVYG